MSNQFMRRKTNKKFRYDDGDEARVGLLDGSDNEDAPNEDINLSVKRKPNIDFIEHEVQEGDTLSSLSLQFNCTISQIKQFNNIHRDNEIFALRVVRIPITPFSVVTEKIATQNSATDTDNVRNDVRDSVSIPQGILVDMSLDQQHSDVDSSSDISVCNPLLTPLPVALISNSPVTDPALEVEAAGIVRNNASFLHCNGADCGIPWLMLFVCTLAIGFVGPLIYIFFLYEDKKHHSEGTLSS